MKIRYIVRLYCPKNSPKLFHEYKTDLEEKAVFEDAEDYLRSNGKTVSDCKIKLIPTSPDGAEIVEM